MPTPLIATLRENCGYLQDQGWHQTAQLMTLAATEIERLTERIQELKEHLDTLEKASSLHAPDPSNQNGVRVAAVSSRR